MYRIVFIATLFCSWKYCKYCKCDPNDNKTANSLKCYSSVLFFYFNVICSRLIKRTEVIISISGWALGCSWLQLWGMKGEVIRERNKSRVLPPGVTGSPLKMEMRSSSVTLPCRHSTTWPSCAKEISPRTWPIRTLRLVISTQLLSLPRGTKSYTTILPGSDKKEHTGLVALGSEPNKTEVMFE